MAFADVVFLLDVDNTLLDSDRFVADLRRRIDRDLGADGAQRYWSIFARQRRELDYVDYLGALQRLRDGTTIDRCSEPGLLQLAGFLIDYPFDERVYPGALQLVERLRTLGRTVVLSDGDAVLQPRKLQRAGLWAAVAGQVLIYPHKELVLDAVQRRYPAARYVLVDDKPRVLAAVKYAWRERVSTVFVRQGHYALEVGPAAARPWADRTVDRIGDLLRLDDAALRGVQVPAALGTA